MTDSNKRMKSINTLGRILATATVAALLLVLFYCLYCFGSMRGTKRTELLEPEGTIP